MNLERVSENRLLSLNGNIGNAYNDIINTDLCDEVALYIIPNYYIKLRFLHDL
jgi:hypothetical protein